MKDLNQLACTFDNETLAKELTRAAQTHTVVNLSSLC